MTLFVVWLMCGEKKTQERLRDALLPTLDRVGADVQDGWEVVHLPSAEACVQAAKAGRLRDARLLFAVPLAAGGSNPEAERLIGRLNACADRRHVVRDSLNCGVTVWDEDDAPHFSVLSGAVGSVIVDGHNDLYTKAVARRLVFAANRNGCTFPGKALVEATGDLHNFEIQARNLQVNRRNAYHHAVTALVAKLLNFTFPQATMPRILAVHASSRRTSNSLSLWTMVRQTLAGRAEIEEVSIKGGQVWDCRGCQYEECLHFGENDTCFYGGMMVEKVYPAIIRSDVVVLICPNYNDSVSADIMAFINRLTAVFRTNDFSHKRVYAIVVSGYSGGDLVTQQIIGAMNLNKNFVLPAEFALLATANDPGSILQINDIEERAEAFAQKILYR